MHVCLVVHTLLTCSSSSSSRSMTLSSSWKIGQFKRLSLTCSEKPAFWKSGQTNVSNECVQLFCSSIFVFLFSFVSNILFLFQAKKKQSTTNPFCLRFFYSWWFLSFYIKTVKSSIRRSTETTNDLFHFVYVFIRFFVCSVKELIMKLFHCTTHCSVEKVFVFNFGLAACWIVNKLKFNEQHNTTLATTTAQ